MTKLKMLARNVDFQLMFLDLLFLGSLRIIHYDEENKTKLLGIYGMRQGAQWG